MAGHCLDYHDMGVEIEEMEKNILTNRKEGDLQRLEEQVRSRC